MVGGVEQRAAPRGGLDWKSLLLKCFSQDSLALSLEIKAAIPTVTGHVVPRELADKGPFGGRSADPTGGRQRAVEGGAPPTQTSACAPCLGACISLPLLTELEVEDITLFTRPEKTEAQEVM